MHRVASIVGELRRRRVIRVTVAYCGLAWVVLEVSGTLLPVLELPSWTLRLIVGLLALGLPCAVVLAWAFDLTPHGIERTPPAPGAVPGAPWGARSGPGGASGSRVVVALPFVDRSPGERYRYLGDGIAEELINGLTGTAGLQVVSRTSAFAFRDSGLDVREIGTRLGACCAVEGSLRVTGDRLRVTVQLVDVERGLSIWSSRYDRPLDDLLDLEEQIARSLVAELVARLGVETGGEPDRAPPGVPVLPVATRDVAAYDHYLRGRQAWNRRTEDSLRDAIVHFQDALAADPGCGQAAAGLADAYAMLMEYGLVAPSEGLGPARSAAARARSVAPAAAETHTAGGLLHQIEWRWDEAEEAFRRAIELNPGYSIARQRRALLLAWRGRSEEAALEMEEARRLDPLSPAIASTAAWLRLYAGDPAGALDRLDPVLRRNSAFTPALVARAYALIGQGRTDDAARVLERLARRTGVPGHTALHGYALGRRGDEPGALAAATALDAMARERYVSAFDHSLPWLGLGRHDRALSWLRRAADEGGPQLVYLAVDPLFDPLRGEAAFEELLTTLGSVRGYDRSTAGRPAALAV